MKINIIRSEGVTGVNVAFDVFELQALADIKLKIEELLNLEKSKNMSSSDKKELVEELLRDCGNFFKRISADTPAASEVYSSMFGAFEPKVDLPRDTISIEEQQKEKIHD